MACCGSDHPAVSSVLQCNIRRVPWLTVTTDSNCSCCLLIHESQSSPALQIADIKNVVRRCLGKS